MKALFGKSDTFDPLQFVGGKATLENGKTGIIQNWNSEKQHFRVVVWSKLDRKQPNKTEPIWLTTDQIQTATNRWKTLLDNENKDLDIKAVKELESSKAMTENRILQCELDWIEAQRPLIFNGDQLQIELGLQDWTQLNHRRHQLLQTYASSSTEDHDLWENTFGALNWNGVATRWQSYFDTLESVWNDSRDTFPTSARAALEIFANRLGRIISYRALALSKSEFESIKTLNRIVPTGGLRATAAELKNIVDTEGVTRITVARLFIAHLSEWIGIDPSVSLHDDWETAVCIAQAYMRARAEKYVYRFEMNVPMIHTIGYTVADVHRRIHLVTDKEHKFNQKRWFCHNSIWFDANDARTERQLLYHIPFFKQRCQSIRVFKTDHELLESLEPFRIAQEQKMKNSDDDETETKQDA